MRAYSVEQLGSFSGYDWVLQSCRNSWMHALVANIPVRLAWFGQDLRASAVLPLATLVDQTPETTPHWNSQEHDFNSVRQGKLGRDFSGSQNSELSRVFESFSSGDFLHPSAAEPLNTPPRNSRAHDFHFVRQGKLGRDFSCSQNSEFSRVSESSSSGGFLHPSAAETLTIPPSYSKECLLKVFRLVQSAGAFSNSDNEDPSLCSAAILPNTCSRTLALESHFRPKFSKARTGNRIKHRQDKGCYSFYKRPHLSKRRGSIREFIQPQSRTPPPRGTPGAPAPPGVNEECSPTLVGALAGKRGAQRRARRRREYRLWRRFSIKARGKRVDPSPLAPARSSAATQATQEAKGRELTDHTAFTVSIQHQGRNFECSRICRNPQAQNCTDFDASSQH